MNHIKADIAIFGAGIAGLWLFNHLRAMGYNAVLLETETIGNGQTIASQGILHSGLKYAFAGKINTLARSISAMPERWRAALKGEGPVDLSAARTLAASQHLLIPKGFIGGVVKLATQKVLGGNVYEVPRTDWPAQIINAGFEGAVIHMDELVLDMPSTLRALAEPYRDFILKIDSAQEAMRHIDASLYLFTAAGSNHEIAKALDDHQGLGTQKRPLLMGMIKNAPYPLYAHLVGTSEKPVATITTHETSDGALVWYLGGGVAERPKEADPEEAYRAIRKAFDKYLPHIDLSNLEWASLPIDRVEGKSKTDGWLPDTPTIHNAGTHLYCWPTKLVFAPMLADMVMEKIRAKGLNPSQGKIDTSGWMQADYTKTPWDKAQWKNAN